MREPKFRAWDKITKKYYAVSTLEYADNGELCEVWLADILVTEPNDACRNPKDVILEQYTGLKDKNGEEIYEGDVLESTWNGDKAVVVWNDVEGEWEHYADFNTHSKYSGSVVIGNIHENPELLEEE